MIAGRRPTILGILNVTPDSFHDGGRWTGAESARARASEMLAEGADAIDLGGESTRPGATPIPIETEWARVGPILGAIVPLGAPVSIDTRKGEIARRALAEGARWVNDVAAGEDPGIFEAARAAGARIILMHKRGEPATMQESPEYEDPVAEVVAYLRARGEAAQDAGIPSDRIAIDPGIGFGKRLADNLAILSAPEAFFSLGYVVCLGASRKSFLAAVGAGATSADRLAGSLAIAADWAGRAEAANARLVLRVHDPGETKRAVASAVALAVARRTGAFDIGVSG